MKTHAFLISAHSFPEQLEDIVNLLYASNHYFFIHIDKKSKKMLSSDAILRLKEKENINFVQPMRVNHGGFSQISCILKLLEEAYKCKCSKIDYVHLISGQDYPCMANSDFDALFEQVEKSYMYFDSMEDTLECRKWNYPYRTDYFNFVDLHVPFLPYKRFRKILIKCLNKLVKIFKRKPITDAYAGWTWFSWHRSVVEYVLTFLKNNPSYIKRFRRTFCMDEIFFHTMLYEKANDLNIVKNNALRFIEWNPRKGEKLDHKNASRKHLLHPLVLDEREYDDIINSGAIFCRKVHPVQSAKLITLLKKRNCHSTIN